MGKLSVTTGQGVGDRRKPTRQAASNLSEISRAVQVWALTHYYWGSTVCRDGRGEPGWGLDLLDQGYISTYQCTAPHTQVLRTTYAALFFIVTLHYVVISRKSYYWISHSYCVSTARGCTVLQLAALLVLAEEPAGLLTGRVWPHAPTVNENLASP